MLDPPFASQTVFVIVDYWHLFEVFVFVLWNYQTSMFHRITRALGGGYLETMQLAKFWNNLNDICKNWKWIQMVSEHTSGGVLFHFKSE